MDTVEKIIRLFAGLTKKEKEELAKELGKDLWFAECMSEYSHIGEFLETVVKLAKNMTQVNKDAMEASIRFSQEVRDSRRKNYPETIRRNVDMIQKRQRDRKTYTIPKLAKDYHLSESRVKQIMREAAMWRSLLGKLPTG
jgi:uncharacterized protein YozE (UPF0346 family)